jgi:hypothetical protein
MGLTTGATTFLMSVRLVLYDTNALPENTLIVIPTIGDSIEEWEYISLSYPCIDRKNLPMRALTAYREQLNNWE